MSSRAVRIGGLIMLTASCVPEGAATSEPPPAARRSTPKLTAAPRVSVDARPDGPLITAPFEDTFERAELGADWAALSPAWRIDRGRLCAKGARNRGVWLSRRLPLNARIEFDATADSAEGDLKVELWGDGASGATGTKYDNATSYLAIFGGWRNSKHVLARLDEHGHDRLELDVDPSSDDERARPVEAGQPYRFKVERSDGRSLEWSVNNISFFKLADPDPLAGPGHEHLGFNDWDAPVCFDNVKITPL